MFGTNRIIRYINQNRKKIILYVGIVAGIIILIQVLNAAAKQSLESRKKNALDFNTLKSENAYQPNKTILSDEYVEEKSSNKNEEIIDKFIKYCMNGEIQSAYEMLTDDCKDSLYQTIEIFNDYCKNIYDKKSNYNIQSWSTDANRYTYKVRYTADMLSTGTVDTNVMEEYITIEEKNGQAKLNISSYIGRDTIEKETTSKDITYKIDYVDSYIDKEIYTLSVTNKTQNTVLLDTLKNSNNIKLIGSNEKSGYQAYINELTRTDVTIPSENTKKVKITFGKDYNPERQAKHLVISQIVLNKEKYYENPDDENNKDSVDIRISK